jgi:hypothetical protein
LELKQSASSDRLRLRGIWVSCQRSDFENTESHIRLFDTNSFFCIINAILTYVVDGYGHYASSALAGVVFVRNIVGAIFPLCEFHLLF